MPIADVFGETGERPFSEINGRDTAISRDVDASTTFKRGLT